MRLQNTMAPNQQTQIQNFSIAWCVKQQPTHVNTPKSGQLYLQKYGFFF